MHFTGALVSLFDYPGVTVATVKNDFPLSPRNGTYVYQNTQSKVHGKKITINGKAIALFCYKDSFYAVDEKCPHLGKCVAFRCVPGHAACIIFVCRWSIAPW